MRIMPFPVDLYGIKIADDVARDEKILTVVNPV
jgi:hypothetical protein